MFFMVIIKVFYSWWRKRGISDCGHHTCNQDCWKEWVSAWVYRTLYVSSRAQISHFNSFLASTLVWL